ncbi:MAG: alpha/beta fold hydrolase [Cyclobacteriaceae bacterium]
MRGKITLTTKILGIVLLTYLILLAGFYLFQDRFVFQSESLPTNYAFTFDQPFEEHFIATGTGDTLNALLFRSTQPAKGLILYFHGNADNLQRWGNYAVDFTSLGYDILMIDYRGYGKSTGTPDETIIYRDAQLVLNWSQANIPHGKLILYGRSLGSAIASNLATTTNPDLLILETPFDELNSALYTFSSKYKFPTKDFLVNVTCKRIIIHGTNDWVVPLSSALKLKPLLKAGDQFIIIEGGSHNNLRDFDEYHKALKEVLK